MMISPESLLLCPRCCKTLPMRPPCTCGFVLRESDGIINLMTDEETAAVQPFVDAYDRVRRDERWGEDDLDLPFHPKRHRNIWNIRQRTFRTFARLVATLERGLALDAGAGNCWMTRWLDRWGFDAIAVDIHTSQADGLRAGQRFLDEGAVFLRVRAGMERLPFASGRFRLIATNASFHYVSDFRSALSEFERVLTPGGKIAIVDTPFYERADDGERMMAERVRNFALKYGIEEALSRRARYLTFKGLQALADSLKLRWRFYPVWPGLPRKFEELRALCRGQRIAQFPVVMLEKLEKTHE